MLTGQAPTQIIHRGQHPYKHKSQEVTYINGTYPAITDVKQALDKAFSLIGQVLSWQTPVANKAALPLTGNSVNDARMVEDDGDGKPAMYVCIATAGNVDAQWLKIADVDWNPFNITGQNCIYVKATSTEIAGAVYTTIADAIAYINSLGGADVPSLTNRWSIILDDITNDEDFTLPDFTSLSGHPARDLLSTTITGDIVLGTFSMLVFVFQAAGTITLSGLIPQAPALIYFTTLAGAVVNPLNQHGVILGCASQGATFTVTGGCSFFGSNSITGTDIITVAATGDLKITNSGGFLVVNTAGGSYTNEGNVYDNTATDLVATDTQEAIDELANRALDRPYFYDEMWNGIRPEWVTKVTTGSAKVVDDEVNGGYILETGAVATNEESIDWGDTIPFSYTRQPIFECRIKMESIAHTEIDIGLFETSGGGDDDYILFRYNASIGSLWRLETSNGGATSYQEGTSADLAETVLKFVFTSDTALDWYINGAFQGNISTNVPTVNLQPLIAIRTETTTTKGLIIDYVRIEQNRD